MLAIQDHDLGDQPTKVEAVEDVRMSIPEEVPTDESHQDVVAKMAVESTPLTEANLLAFDQQEQVPHHDARVFGDMQMTRHTYSPTMQAWLQDRNDWFQYYCASAAHRDYVLVEGMKELTWSVVSTR